MPANYQPMIQCPGCGKVRRRYARRLCWMCWRARRQAQDRPAEPQPPACTQCGGNRLFADGLCRRCYRRAHRRPRPPALPPPDRCRHCGRVPPSRPRGLCWACYETPGIREKYGRCPRYSHVSPVGLGVKQPTWPERTDARPGTEEKVAILEARAAAGQELFHLADGPRELD